MSYTGNIVRDVENKGHRQEQIFGSSPGQQFEREMGITEQIRVLLIYTGYDKSTTVGKPADKVIPYKDYQVSRGFCFKEETIQHTR